MSLEHAFHDQTLLQVPAHPSLDLPQSPNDTSLVPLPSGSSTRASSREVQMNEPQMVQPQNWSKQYSWGEGLGLEKQDSTLDISEGLLLEPNHLPQTPGQGQGW